VENTRHVEECLENKLYEIVIGTAEVSEILAFAIYQSSILEIFRKKSGP
jgi:hypothetical protein